MSGSDSLACAVCAGVAIVLASSAWSAAGAYDDVPEPGYYVIAPAEPVPVYGYSAVRPGVRVYGYLADRPGARVYGYGPVYRAEPLPSPRRDRQPLGTYAPSEPSNLSPPRGFFLGLERVTGGD